MSDLSPNFAPRLESVFGPSHIAIDPALCSDYAIDEVIPPAVAKPAAAEHAAEILRFALLEKLSVIPCGNRTKLAIGMPPTRYDIALDMTSLNQIAHYDPDDLTLSVDAGANFNDFAVPLYRQKQFLPLSVPFYFESTIGGIVASGVDSSLRHSYGTVRDFLLGAEFIDGTGSLCKSGGRVVKNVSGYDLHKLLIGSLGSLGVITRLNFRTFPLPPEARGLVASFASAAQAFELCRLISASPFHPASVDLLGPNLMQIFQDRTPEPDPLEPAPTALAELFPQNSWHLCISIEGTAEVCNRYVRELTQFANQAGAQKVHVLDADDTAGPDLWHHISQTIPALLATSPSATIFKIAQLPTRLPALLSKLTALADQADLPHTTLARASGILYFALLPQSNDALTHIEPEPMDAATLPQPESIDAATTHARLESIANSIFTLCSQESATASLPWCPTQLKRSINIWGPPRPDHALMRRLKSAFDPHNLLAPSRLLIP
jgi:glycolate oxidase FAD binding subunit